MKGGHGHVIPQPDGLKARCGGPSMCTQCKLEVVLVQADALVRAHPGQVPGLQVAVDMVMGRHALTTIAVCEVCHRTVPAHHAELRLGFREDAMARFQICAGCYDAYERIITLHSAKYIGAILEDMVLVSQGNDPETLYEGTGRDD